MYRRTDHQRSSSSEKWVSYSRQLYNLIGLQDPQTISFKLCPLDPPSKNVSYNLFHSLSAHPAPASTPALSAHLPVSHCCGFGQHIKRVQREEYVSKTELKLNLRIKGKIFSSEWCAKVAIQPPRVHLGLWSIRYVRRLFLSNYGSCNFAFHQIKVLVHYSLSHLFCIFDPIPIANI